MSFFKKRVREGMADPEYAAAYAEADREVLAEADEMEGFKVGFILVASTVTVVANTVHAVQQSSEPFGLLNSSPLPTAALLSLQGQAVGA